MLGQLHACEQGLCVKLAPVIFLMKTHSPQGVGIRGLVWFGFQFGTDTTELNANSELIAHVSAQLREGTLYMSEAGVLETSSTHQKFQAYCDIGRSLIFFFQT